MKAVFLTRSSKKGGEFELLETNDPTPGKDDVKIKVTHFGLNYADVMAAHGLYNDCPPLPAILGYECVGNIIETGENISKELMNKRVLAFTRFGSYAEYACTNANGIIELNDAISSESALALATQYSTAWYAAVEMVNLHAEDVVMIHAAGGGVGTALLQICKWKKCKIIALAGSDEKREYVLKNGADHFINYKKENYVERVKQLCPKGVDICFNAVAGDTIKKDRSVLGTGGRLVLFGVAQRSGSRPGLLPNLRLLLKTGFLSPLFLLVKSQGIIGFNMLSVGKNKPEVLKRCMENVMKLTNEGVLKPFTSKVFPVNEINQAHQFLSSGKSIGKIGVRW